MDQRKHDDCKPMMDFTPLVLTVKTNKITPPL